LIDLFYKSYAKVSGDRLAWKFFGSSLRILCYHGVCADHLAHESWMPSYFVTRSAFDFQLGYLRQQAVVLPLSEAMRRLRDGSLPSAAVSLTFDDGYANNIAAALPLLEKHRLPATLFLSTAYIETGDWYPFLKVKLLRLFRPAVDLPEYKSNPVDVVRDATRQHWAEVEAGLTPEQYETLRPLTVAEVQAVESPLLEFGAHSHTHPLARNESGARRREEVRVSVRKVAEWARRTASVYSYPNGEAGDFGEPEAETLRDEGIDAAVTGVAGANRWPCPPYELRRYPLTLKHDEWRFRAEATGLRTALLRVTGTRHS